MAGFTYLPTAPRRAGWPPAAGASKEKRCYEPRLRDVGEGPAPGKSISEPVAGCIPAQAVSPGERLWVLGPPCLALGVIPSPVADSQRLGPGSQSASPVYAFAPLVLVRNLDRQPITSMASRSRRARDVVLTSDDPCPREQNLARASYGWGIRVHG